jgi:hypothetical protein
MLAGAFEETLTAVSNRSTGPSRVSINRKQIRKPEKGREAIPLASSAIHAACKTMKSISAPKYE